MEPKSMRRLASELGVNKSTVAKAVKEARKEVEDKLTPSLF